MITGDAAWSTALAAEYKQPIFALEIASQKVYLMTALPSLVSGAPAGAAPVMYVPAGLGQSVNELDGASSIGNFEVLAIDPTGFLRPIAASLNMIGSIAVIKLGFAGLAYSDFGTIGTYQVFRTGADATGRVTFTLQDVQRLAKRWSWTNGGPTAWSPGTATPAQPVGPAFAANSYPCSDTNPRFVQGNPMDIFLVILQNEMGVGQASADPTTWTIYDPIAGTGLINPNSYVDVPGILALRDSVLSGDWMEFKITGTEEGKSWVEQEILKPLGLYTIAKASGQLTLKSMKTPVSQAALESWTQASILGIPTVERLDPINVITVRMNVDDTVRQTASRLYQGEVTFQESASVLQYRQEYQWQIESRGWRAERGGFARAWLTSNRIFRRHAYGTPIYTVRVQLRNLRPELGDYVSLTHPLVIDYANAGAVGVSAVICEVVDRQPDFPNRTLEYKLMDTRFVKLSKAYQVAPVGTPVWTSASAAQKAQDMFIALKSGKYSDGVAGNVIF